MTRESANSPLRSEDCGTDHVETLRHGRAPTGYGVTGVVRVVLPAHTTEVVVRTGCDHSTQEAWALVFVWLLWWVERSKI